MWWHEPGGFLNRSAKKLIHFHPCMICTEYLNRFKRVSCGLWRHFLLLSTGNSDRLSEISSSAWHAHDVLSLSLKHLMVYSLHLINVVLQMHHHCPLLKCFDAVLITQASMAWGLYLLLAKKTILNNQHQHFWSPQKWLLYFSPSADVK